MPKFIFVIGIGRSGTSLLQNMLNSHEEVCFLPENSFLRRFLVSGIYDRLLGDEGARGLANTLSSDIAFKRLGLSAGQLENMLDERSGADEFFRAAAESYADGRGEFRYFGDKDPRLIEYLPILKSLFPDATVIHIYRDPRDVVLSKAHADWSRDRAMVSNLFAGRAQWHLAKKNGRTLFGRRYHELAYEKLIDEPDAELEKVCKLLDIEFSSKMLNPIEGGRALVADDELAWKKQSIGPLLSNNTEKWRSGLSPAQVVLAERISRPIMDDAGYAVSNAHSRVGFLTRCWVAIQAVAVSLISPGYCWYRTWMQRS